MTEADRAASIEWLRFHFPLGTTMTKKSGSNWTGKVVGYYATDLTPQGLAIESDTETGSVQIYPTKALELVRRSGLTT